MPPDGHGKGLADVVAVANANRHRIKLALKAMAGETVEERTAVVDDRAAVTAARPALVSRLHAPVAASSALSPVPRNCLSALCDPPAVPGGLRRPAPAADPGRTVGPQAHRRDVVAGGRDEGRRACTQRRPAGGPRATPVGAPPHALQVPRPGPGLEQRADQVHRGDARRWLQPPGSLPDGRPCRHAAPHHGTAAGVLGNGLHGETWGGVVCGTRCHVHV